MVKIMRKSTVVSDLVFRAVHEGYGDIQNLYKNGFTGFSNMSCGELVAQYNKGRHMERVNVIIDDDGWNMSAIGPDDVVTIVSMFDETHEMVPAGTKCTVMDYDQYGDDNTYYNTLQIDENGHELKCAENRYMLCSEIE